MDSPPQHQWSFTPKLDSKLTPKEKISAIKAFRGSDEPPVRYLTEDIWAAMLPQVVARGYILRPRYREGWKPSWSSVLETIGHRVEDAIPARQARFIDAERVHDHAIVAFKQIIPSHAEGEIASYLSSESFRSDPRNHCVPILDVFSVNDGKFGWNILVMPLLRTFDDPAFETIGDCTSFVRQMLEGLCFIHEHGIAHRDCTGANIMMDATQLFPDGWHPQSPSRSRDAKRRARAKSRRSLKDPIRYYYADWGLSSRHSPEDPEPRVLGTQGQDSRPPELSNEIPYDPFKLDIHILGGLFLDSILEKTSSLDFLIPLVQEMRRDIPQERPSAIDAFRIFEEAQASVTPRQLRSRLKPRSQEGVMTRVLLDALDLFREIIYILWNFFANLGM